MHRSVRVQRYLRLALGVVTLGLIVFAVLALLRRGPRREPVNLAVEGLNTQYFAFDEAGRQAVRVRCRESRWEKNERLRLLQVEGGVARHGRMSRDIRFQADSGLVGEDFNYFLLDGHARIQADDLELRAANFLMAGKKDIYARDQEVSFSGRELNGVARRGLEFYTEMNMYKMFTVAGDLQRAGRRYAFSADELLIVKEKAYMQLVGHARLQTDDTLLEGEQILMQFSADFESLLSYAVHGEAVMERRERGAGRERLVDVRCRIIECLTENGCLTQMGVYGPGVIRIVEPRQQLLVSGERIDVFFNGPTGRIGRMTAATDCQIEVSEQRRYSLFGRSLDAAFAADGGLGLLRLQGGRMLFDRYRGEAPQLELDMDKRQIRLLGEPSIVQRGDDRFVSTGFQLDTRSQSLRAEQRVQATVVPAARSAVLDREPMFLTAAGMQVGESGNPVSFTGQVVVFQGATELTCARLELDDKARRTVASGAVALRFREQQEDIRLEAERLFFPRAEDTLTAAGAAVLRQGENRLQAGKLELQFAADRQLDTIRGSGQVAFNQDRLEGRSQELEWRYRDSMVFFRKAAQITRPGSGTSRGRELQLNLKTHDVTVHGQTGRTETVLQD